MPSIRLLLVLHDGSIGDDFGFDQPNGSAALSCYPLTKTNTSVASVKDSICRVQSNVERKRQEEGKQFFCEDSPSVGQIGVRESPVTLSLLQE